MTAICVSRFCLERIRNVLFRLAFIWFSFYSFYEMPVSFDVDRACSVVRQALSSTNHVAWFILPKILVQATQTIRHAG
jgi:hypothetical protein